LESGVALSRAAVPFTTIPDRPRLGIITYTVQPGDTLSGIAESYGLSLDTVMWAGGLELCPQLLRIEQQLMILPVDGVHHTVEEGDTLADIASRYRAQPEAIVGWEPNGLEAIDSPLMPGQVLIIPDGIKETISTGITAYSGEEGEPSRLGSGRFAWPLSGRIHILDWFNTTTMGGRPGGTPRPWPHKGVDISAFLGTPILAADSGSVSVAQFGGYNGGYGNYVVVNHGNGFSTLYAHMSSLSVQAGEVVAKGQRLGAAGATGMATGAHLHFEIRYNSVQRNPLCFLSMASQ
jgi:murein DD-endopeptidase MepM/ murein hydrolase activator NlpD